MQFKIGTENYSVNRAYNVMKHTDELKVKASEQCR